MAAHLDPFETSTNVRIILRKKAPQETAIHRSDGCWCTSKRKPSEALGCSRVWSCVFHRILCI